MAALFRLERSRTPEDVRAVVEALLEWLAAPEQQELRRTFAVWVRRVLLPARLPRTPIPETRDLLEVRDMLAERVKEWTEQWKREGLEAGRREGLQQGLQQGRRQAAADALVAALEARFETVPDDILDQVRAVEDLEKLLQLLRQAVRAEDLEAFRAALRNVLG